MELQNITYAGHSAVFLDYGAKKVAIDPWLKDNPRCPDNLKKPGQLDLIILTHGHSDHSGGVVELANQCEAKVAANFELINLLIKDGLAAEKACFMNKGGTVDIDGLKVTLTYAYHSSSYEINGQALYAGEPCGVIIRDTNTCVYHAGDTGIFSDMKLIGELYSPDIAFLPIGDVFTMGPSEAALAARFVGCKVAIPIHYKTFDLLTGTAEDFKKECSSNDNLKVVVLEPGENYTPQGN
ncbi:MAG: metal-dependent hydrolase [Candidatus Dadabacteria bacterium]|nr:MAG: metal-dependent hydrolase [Candidatus Dadabacteria bacterium]